MLDFKKLGFKLRDETLKRCKVFDLDDQMLRKFVPINAELFHFLYEAKSLSFNVYFRVENTMIEFIRMEEFSTELLDQLWTAMQKSQRRLEINVLKSQLANFEQMLEDIRSLKVKRLLDEHPSLDRKVLNIFGNLSSASQLIVRGGITKSVVEQVTASAHLMVNNLMDSSGAIATLSRMVTADPTLYDHSASVAMIASVVAMECTSAKLDSRQIEVIAKCGLYHDVGKTCVPSAILNKPGKFSPEEFEVMKSHTVLGEEELSRVCKTNKKIELECVRVAGEHHEKFDGHGYPNGRVGRLEERPDGIHFYSRIVTIADVYSALLMKRCYKDAFEPQDAVKLMAETAQNDYDPDVFPRFLRSVVGSLNDYQNSAGGDSSSGGGRILLIDDNGHIRERNNLKKVS
jgi:putative nucleotidyltransferase with HDIG domain